MSIATLKRKTMTEYNRMSVGYTNFSLNGTRRNQGYVGQTMLSRSLPKTLMVGNTPRGYGGCCGTYRITPIVQSAVQSTEDSNIIKPSVLNTYGLMKTKYRWIRRPQPFSVTKPDSNENFNDQGTYIFILQQNTLKCNAEIDASANLLDIGTPTNAGCLKSKDDQVQVVCNNITKSNTYTGAIDQGMYIQRVDSACTNNIMFPMNTQNVPFGCNINL